MPIYAEKRKGRLTGSFVIEVTEDGQRMKARAKTLDEAKQIEKDMLRGRWAKPEAKPEASYVSLRDLILKAKFLRPKGKKANWTFRELEYVETLLGADIDVESITSKRLGQLALEIVADRQCKPATANRYVYALMGVLSWGRSQDLVTRGAVFKRLDEGDTTRTRWLTVEQEELVVDWLMANGRVVEACCVVALSLTGMRSGELLSLRADQIDYEAGFITLEDQKDGTGQEAVLIDTLVARQLYHYALGGQLPSPKTLLKYFKQAAKACGIPVGARGKDGVVIHSLRHSTATRLVQHGVNLAEVKDYMRHKSMATTMRYVKITGQQKRNALETLRNAGQKVRGIFDEKGALVAQEANIDTKIREEDQIVGSLSRTRTCDHSINSHYTPSNDKEKK